MPNADDLRDANPWAPTTKPLDLAHLGKLAEECNELAAAIARCIIQGIDEREPVTGKLNREWLEDEVADVRANLLLVCEHFQLSEARMSPRTTRKMQHLRQWHGMLGTTSCRHELKFISEDNSGISTRRRPHCSCGWVGYGHLFSDEHAKAAFAQHVLEASNSSCNN